MNIYDNNLIYYKLRCFFIIDSTSFRAIQSLNKVEETSFVSILRLGRVDIQWVFVFPILQIIL